MKDVQTTKEIFRTSSTSKHENFSLIYFCWSFLPDPDPDRPDKNQCGSGFTTLWAVLWNRNYLLQFRFRFWLLKSYESGSGSDFWKVMVPVPVPTFELFYKEKVHEFQKIYGKIWMKKMFNEGNQIHYFISSSSSGTVIIYGSGSDFLTSYGSGYGSGSTSKKVTVPTVPVPVPQHWLWATGNLETSVGDPRHFGADPDPRIRTSD